MSDTDVSTPEEEDDGDEGDARRRSPNWRKRLRDALLISQVVCVVVQCFDYAHVFLNR